MIAEIAGNEGALRALYVKNLPLLKDRVTP
jgi:hypothetical protein